MQAVVEDRRVAVECSDRNMKSLVHGAGDWSHRGLRTTVVGERTEVVVGVGPEAADEAAVEMIELLLREENVVYVAKKGTPVIIVLIIRRSR